MLELPLYLNVTYSVLLLLVSFREAPWSVLIYYVWYITTTWQEFFATSIWFTTYIVTVSHRYMSALCYHKIHMMRYICSSCISIDNKYVILLCFVVNHHKTLLISQVLNQFFCDFFVTPLFAAVPSWKHRSPTQIKH